MPKQRYATTIEDDTIYVGADVGRVEVGPVEDLFKVFDEHYEIEYDEYDKQRYPDLDTSDEGLEIPVRETVEQMTHSKQTVEFIKSRSLERDEDSDGLGVSPRMALFTGMVRNNLRDGVF